MKALKKYVSVYRLMWKQVTDYRFEFLAELVCTFIPVIALYYLWSDIYIAENSIKGMKFGEIFLYIVLARFISMIITPILYLKLWVIYRVAKYNISFVNQSIILDIRL